MIGRSADLALLLIAASSASLAQTKLPVPVGGDPAMACGQNPDGRAYWTEYGFCDVAVRGPKKAIGLIFWSHGVNGNQDQFKSSPPPFVRRLATAGWDVVKINRNALYENR